MKIIIDTGGAIRAAARRLGIIASGRNEFALTAACEAYEIQSDANLQAFLAARPGMTSEQIDEWHAWSELDCHRAAAMRELAESEQPLDEVRYVAPLIVKWTEESRLFATRMAGSEYHGAFIVNGTTGIARKES